MWRSLSEAFRSERSEFQGRIVKYRSSCRISQVHDRNSQSTGFPMFFTMPKNPMGWNSAPFENPSRRGRLKVSKRYISSCTRYFLLRRTHRTDVTLIVLYKINFDHKSLRKIWKKIVKNFDNLVWCLRFTTYRKMHTINRLDGPYLHEASSPPAAGRRRL